MKVTYEGNQVDNLISALYLFFWVLFLLLLQVEAVYAQSFTLVENATLPVWNTSSEWGDFDNDGDYDLIMTGNTADPIMLYVNQGNMEFARVDIGNTYNRYLRWQDADGDSDLDLYDGGTLLLNEGNTMFQNVFQISNKNAEWGDLDSDGDLDLASRFRMIDQISPGLWRNRLGFWTLPESTSKKATDDWIELSDYDADGDLDVLTYSQAGLNQDAELFIQNGPGQFNRAFEFTDAIKPIHHVSFNDFDSDGDQDVLLISGYSQDLFAAVYRNSDGALTPEPRSMPSSRTTDTGDIDLDGDIDIVIVEEIDNKGYLHLFHNTGTGDFIQTTEQLDFVVGNTFLDELILVDFDNDGDLDIYFTHEPYDATNLSVRFLRNDGQYKNEAPTPPVELFSSIEAGNVQLTWASASDTETPTPGLSYRLRVGSQPGLADIVQPQANLISGQALVIRDARKWPSLVRRIVDLSAGTYYWAVQTLDASGNASPFSNEATFTTAGPPPLTFISAEVQLDSIETTKASWGDYDADGDHDLMLRRQSQEKRLYRNEGNNMFVQLAGEFEVCCGPAVWTDYDTDGDLDIILKSYIFEAGEEGYYNRSQYLEGLEMDQCLQATDFDHDGDQDVLGFSGRDEDALPVVFLNQGNDSFIASILTLLDIEVFSGIRGCGWHDFDGDADEDLLVSLYAGEGRPNTTTLYRNDSNGQFSAVLVINDFALEASEFEGIDFSDYDADGDDDLLIVGYDYEVLESKVRLYRNDGVNGMNRVTEGFPGDWLGVRDSKWVDFDGDGDLDLYVHARGYFQFYQNSNGILNPFDARVPEAIFDGLLEWTDLNGDGAIDFIYSGVTPYFTGTNPYLDTINQIYLNQQEVINAKPAPPANLQNTTDGARVTLSWDASTDPESSDAGLTYQVRVGTFPGGQDVVSANFNAGIQQLPGPGNAGHRTNWTLDHLINGTYYWSVQAIDATRNASDYAGEASFELTTSDVQAFISRDSGITLDDRNAHFAWGDYDADGDLDVITIGQYMKEDSLRLFRNNGGFEFEKVDAGLPQFTIGKSAWSDYDADGDLDLAIAGAAVDRRIGVLMMRNEGPSGFVEDTLLASGMGAEHLIWVDYDNDGDVDLSINEMSVYRNTHGRFSIVNLIRPKGETNGAVWDDFDRDQDFDIFYEGKLVENRRGIFVQSEGEVLPAGIVNAVDYNVDGYPDILINNALYKNNTGNLVATELQWPDILVRDATVGDINGDGMPDLFFRDYDGTVTLLQNNGETFDEIDRGFRGGNGDNSQWVDVDGDGRLDFVTLEFENGFSIYQNIGGKVNTRPDAPTSLVSEVEEGTARLIWQASTDNETPTSALRYNVRVGTTAGAQDVMPAMVIDASGMALIGGQSNVSYNTGWTLRFLPDGDYYWSVQTVDSGGLRSDFSPEQSFTISNSDQLSFEPVIIELPEINAPPVPKMVLEPHDINADGVSELLLGGLRPTESKPYAFFLDLYEKSGVNHMQLAHSPDTTLNPVAQAQWGDYDNDNDADLLVTSIENGVFLKLYRNDGESGFVEQPVFADTLYNLHVVWADYSNDGALDIVFIGRLPEASSIFQAFVLRNERENGFELIPLNLPELEACSIMPLDIDVDGDLDFFTSGISNGWFNCPSSPTLYVNDGGIYDRKPVTERPAGDAMDWADYDADGDLDLVIITVEAIDYKRVTTGRVYNNQGAYAFEEVLSFPGLESSVKWVDLNSDGYLDIFQGALDQSVGYLNQKNGSFAITNLDFPGAATGTATWYDHNLDNRSDIIIPVLSASRDRAIATVFINESGSDNQPPSAPSNLAVDFSAGQDIAVLSWAASQDAETPANGLSYHLRVGTSPGGSEVLSAQLTSSNRRGNIGQNLAWPLYLPLDKTYYWAVQAVDASSAFSPFSESIISRETAVEDFGTVPQQIRLHANYPNPFSEQTRLLIDLPQAAEVSLVLYDVLGRQVHALPAQPMASGWQRTLILDAGQLASGTYFYTLKINVGGAINFEKGHLIIMR